MPNESGWAHFFTVSGIEYEAQGHMPFLWLALFDEKSIRIDPANRNGFSEDDRAYAYLIDNKERCIARMQRLYALISNQQDNVIVRKISEWIQRLQSEPYSNVIVRTEELDWMSKEGGLEQDLKKALRHLNEALSRSEFRFSNATRDLCGLSEIDELLSCEPTWLLGGANGPSAWPEDRLPNHTAAQVVPNKSKPWWKIWG
jgi:hypothetical protein